MSGNDSNPMQCLKKYLGCERLFYLSSGRAALWVALKAFSRLKPDRKEVIIPAYSCPSIVSATLKAGLRPVLCDVNLQDFGFFYEDLENKVNAKTLAIIVVHLYGYPVQFEQIRKLCKDNNSYLVEDAAQAFGNTLPDSPDTKVGLAGDAGFYSFGRGKPISIMQGGLLAAQSEEVYGETEKIYKDLNECPAYQNINYCFSLGIYSLFLNAYLYWLPQMLPFLNLGGTIFEPEFETSKGLGVASEIACMMISRLEKEQEVRKANSKWFAENLEQRFINRGSRSGAYPYLRYPLIIDDRDLRSRILERLITEGTGATGSYPTPLNELPKLREVLADKMEYSCAKILSESIVTLPVHSGLSAKDRENIKRIIEQEGHAN